jgi:hypothetical protein
MPNFILIYHPPSVAGNAFCGVMWRSNFISSCVQNWHFVTRIKPSTYHATFRRIQGKTECRLDVLNNTTGTHTHTHTHRSVKIRNLTPEGKMCNRQNYHILSDWVYVRYWVGKGQTKYDVTLKCSSNHSCRGKAIIVKYYERRAVAFYFLSDMRILYFRAVLRFHLLPVPFLPYSSTLSHKRHCFFGKVYWA